MKRQLQNPSPMDYEGRLLVAAEFVLASDLQSAPISFDSADLGVTASLKPHQIEGLSWLIRRYDLGVNVILGDEMGLGKTLQAISFLSYLKTHSMSHGPFLVLCPLSVTDGWISEFNKFCLKLVVLSYVGDKEHRRGLRRTMYEHVQRLSSSSDQWSLPFDVMLTTYDIALLDQDFLSQIPWQYTVVDEAQRLKNASSVLYRVLEQKFVMPRRLLLTGTPIQNNLSELWALMHFCMPTIFRALEQFLSTFKEAGNLSAGGKSATEKRQLQILRYILRAFMLRRTKAMLIERGTLTLPPLTEITVMVPLVDLQKKVYLSILRRELPALLSLSSGSSSSQSLQNIVMQLRKACSHPYLFAGVEPEPYEEGEHLVQASGKLVVLDLLLQKLHLSGHRVLLFCQMTHTLDILQDFLQLRKYTYERLDGSVRAEERFAAIRSFSAQSSKENTEHADDQSGAFIFMISTRAGGVGLNLVAADTVIFYEQDWNPQVDKQALQRAHRIGQMNHVLSINLVTEHTIEEAIMRRAEKKLELSNNVIQQENTAFGVGKDVGVEASDIRSLVMGLQMFDPTDVNKDSFNTENMIQLNEMTEKVVKMRNYDKLNDDACKFEINPTEIMGRVVNRSTATTSFDSGLDETSYLSWLNKLNEASPSEGTSSLDQTRRRHNSEEYQQKREAAKKKEEEKRMAKWEALGYQSLAVRDPDTSADHDVLADSGCVNFVYGDCTNPSKVCPSEPAIIFSCVDNSGKWGHGGMFNALASLSTCIPDAYERAAEYDDLHMGDLHLIKINEGTPDSEISDREIPVWVALAVVQSYNPKRKVPRSDISISDLEECLKKVSFSAAQKSASIHMPRVGYQDKSQQSQWYTVERLLRKYASTYGINIFVYYYRRPSNNERANSATETSEKQCE